MVREGGLAQLTDEVIGRGVAAGGPALLHVLGLRSPDGLAEPITRAIPADRNTTTGTVPIGVSLDESAVS